MIYWEASVRESAGIGLRETSLNAHSRTCINEEFAYGSKQVFIKNYV
jgi:hypothetical protein